VDKFVRPSLGKIRIKELETADVARLHRRLASTPYQANRVLAVVSKLCSWAEANGYRPKYSNPARGIEKYAERGRERYLSAVEIERLGKALSESDDEWPTAIAALKLLIFTGARHREITRLRWDQIDMERGIARLDDAKTGRRNIQLPAPALKVLVELPRRVNNPHVIWGRRTGSHLINLHDAWHRIRAKAGLPDIRIHDLRHSVGSIAVAGGASLRLVGAVLGHASVLTSGRYAHVAHDPAKAVAEKVGAEIDALLTKGAGAPARAGGRDA
jgi:integrase